MPSAADVRFGVQLGRGQAASLAARARQIEALGFDSAWVGDHVSFHTPTLDSLTVLSYVAALTSRIRLGPCVYLLALRHPTVTAKAVATLDLLSGGRLVFGVGVGGEFAKEFEACGVPHAERGARVDEAIAVCRALWGPSPVSFDGRFVRFADVSVEPKPVRPGGPPIWIGGRSDAALRRAARLGDGWVAYLSTPARYRESLAKIGDFAAAAGRALPRGRGFETALLLFTVVDDDGDRAHAVASQALTRQYNQPFEALARKYCLLGPPDRCVETLGDFVEAGVRTFVIAPLGGADRFGEQIERFATEIAPRFAAGSAREDAPSAPRVS